MSLYSILFCHVALDLCSQYIRDQLSACATCDGRRYTHSYQFSSTVLDAGFSTVHGFQNAQSRLHSSSGFLHASDTKRRGLQPMLCCVVFIQHCLPQRRASEISWNVTSPRRPDPWSRPQTEIDSFVGWLLELLPLPYDRSGQLRRQLRSWQMQLRRRCSGVRLRWHEAYAVYALEFCL